MSTPPPVWPPQPGSPSPFRTPPQRSNATRILVLGILSIVLVGFGLILGPVAWLQGNAALALLNAGVGTESQRGSITTGRLCGIVGTVISVLCVLAFFGLHSVHPIAAKP